MPEEKGALKPANITLVVQDCIHTLSSPQVSLTTYHNFSVQLLQSADQLIRSAGEIEEHSSSAGRDEKQEHRALVISSIFLSLAFIEATINELCWAAKHSIKSLKCLESNMIKNIAAIPEKTSTLEKYQLVLKASNKTLFAKGKPPFQNVDNLKSLRNKLIHYEPEWITGNKPQKVELRLKGKFELNPFLKKVKGSPFFPFNCLSHGCAEWALRSTIAFVDDFCMRMTLRPKYEDYRSSLKVCADKRPRGMDKE